MSKKVTRREFIKNSGKIGVSAVVGSFGTSSVKASSLFTADGDIAIVSGTDYFQNTIKAVDAIGGMAKFVTQGSKVGVLINSDFEHPGTFVNPDISIASIKMIFDAGASEVTMLQVVKEDYWKRSSLYNPYKDLLARLKQVDKNTFPAEFNEEDFVKMEYIKGAKALKYSEVVRKWIECDVFVNIPIAKHHATTILTGALKNIMGISTRKANVGFHLDSGVKNDPNYLAQCIVDQHLIRKSDLCITDATEFIINKGPSGPGDIIKLNKVLAGTDIVAIDSICTEYLGYEPAEILTNIKAQDAGLGTMDFSKLKIIEIEGA
jgi:uncharacterized protein (DUF362 family)